ncbi:MAG: hypothetical protein PVG35_03495 [Desulfobacterales bacterium]
MERAMLWFKCAAMHDPVRPVIKQAAVIGWEAKQRQVELVLERSFTGEELLRRMKGWFTVDVHQAIDIIQQHGKLRVLDDVDLVVETHDPEQMAAVSKKLAEVFGEEAWLEPIAKKLLT